ncbi:hypothetical protein [Nocardia farcinica]|uniref:hypothetical protein n=1 Tax=Nocardia farcinica TaxID=37329 RepID=UPI002454BAC5|nr:hypothetical protein [Nocardia farcinica]
MRLDAASFAIHDKTGAQLGTIECPESFSWSRELNEVSKLTLTAPIQELAEVVTPWAHWVSCWHGTSLQWFGVVVDPIRSRTAMSIEAMDVSRLMWETRTLTTKQWRQMDVAPIAADMWREMLDLHGVSADPIVLPSRTESRFDFAVKSDLKMLHQEMSELSKLGLRWTVVRGRPVLGNQPAAPAAELEECHMAEGIQIRRSGRGVKTDVRVQGKNGAFTERRELGGLVLQSIVNLDDLFGVSNIQRAAADYVKRTARIRDELVVPASSTLTADAPIELDDLVPGINLSVSALGLRTVLRVDQVQVAGSPTGTDVALTLSTPDNLSELEQAGGRVAN